MLGAFMALVGLFALHHKSAQRKGATGKKPETPDDMADTNPEVEARLRASQVPTAKQPIPSPEDRAPRQPSLLVAVEPPRVYPGNFADRLAIVQLCRTYSQAKTPAEIQHLLIAQGQEFKRFENPELFEALIEGLMQEDLLRLSRNKRLVVTQHGNNWLSRERMYDGSGESRMYDA